MNERGRLAGWAELRGNRLLFLLVVAYAFIWVGSAIRPVHYEDWLIENLLVLTAFPVLIVLYRFRILSNVSYVLLFLFFCLHAIGAHFTYTEMPLGNWMRDTLNLSRNHYDRVVHLSFGLLVAYPVQEILMRASGIYGVWSYVLPAHVVMAWSALYEVIEGLVAHLVSPELGASFNGIQGDVWDAQKDMSLAMVGAVICMLMAAALQSRRSRRQNVSDLQGLTL